MSAKDGICQDCRHYAAMTSECRESPPTAFMLVGPNNNGGPPQVKFAGAWPPIAKDKWCGKFVRDTP